MGFAAFGIESEPGLELEADGTDGTEPGSADGPAPDPVDGAPLPLALAELLADVPISR